MAYDMNAETTCINTRNSYSIEIFSHDIWTGVNHDLTDVYFSHAWFIFSWAHHPPLVERELILEFGLAGSKVRVTPSLMNEYVFFFPSCIVCRSNCQGLPEIRWQATIGITSQSTSS
jgi:hypothetical protein